jgi:hypothetical protein
MSFDEPIPLASVVMLSIGVVAGLAAALLAFKDHRRLSRQERTMWIGSAFDTNLVAPRVLQVRRDYVVALHCRPHPRFHPATLLAAARQSLSRRAYFRAQEPLEAEPSENAEGESLSSG